MVPGRSHLRRCEGRRPTTSMNRRWIGVWLLALAAGPGCQTAGAVGDPLEWTLGTWRGTRVAADGSAAEPMTLRVERLASGAGQVECLRVEGASGPYVGFAIRSRDPDTGRWTMVYANSAQHRFARLEADLSAAAGTWTSVTAEPGRDSRLVFERVGEDHWRRTQLVSTDAGRTWQVLFTDELERTTDRPATRQNG